MTRQFFVGGNFKMNPATREAKRALIQTLNEATLDPNTGEQNVPRTPASRPDDLTIPFHSRGRHRTPGPVFDNRHRPFAQRRQGRGSELPR